MIKIDFEFDSRFGVFRDALHLPEDHGLTDQEIEDLKKQRYDNWIAVLETPPQDLPPLPVAEPALEAPPDPTPA